MFSKLIITVFVIVVAFVVLRQKNTNQSKSTRQAKAAKTSKPQATISKDTEKDQLSKDMRLGAYLFLLLTTGIGGAVYYFQWQDDHSVLTINLYRDSQVEPVSYDVYKYQLSAKSFVTIDGLSVAVASSERMEIIGLE